MQNETMELEHQSFLKRVTHIAAPATLQVMLQSSVMSIIDQLMIGQLGSVSISGIGIASSFTSIYACILTGISTIAGIMIANNMGDHNEKQVSKSLSLNFLAANLLALLFAILCYLCPRQIADIYTNDPQVLEVAASYMRILSLNIIPLAVISINSALLRCLEKSVYPMIACIFGACVNIFLDYCLIFGNLGFPRLAAEGAAIATVMSQVVSMLLSVSFTIWFYRRHGMKLNLNITRDVNSWKMFFKGLFPVVISSFAWIFSQNYFTVVYSHLGTEDYAAYVMTLPVAHLSGDFLCGVAMAASVLIGKYEGARDHVAAYQNSKKLVRYTIVLASGLGIFMILIRGFYCNLFLVEPQVKEMAQSLLVLVSCTFPFRLVNMVLGDGIIRSAGKTQYTMVVMIVGCIVIGLPVAYLAGNVFKLDIRLVYICIAMEEFSRLVANIIIFRKKKWMKQ